MRRRLSANQEESPHQEPNPAGTLTLDFQPPGLSENKFVLIPQSMVSVVATRATKTPLTTVSIPEVPSSFSRVVSVLVVDTSGWLT